MEPGKTSFFQALGVPTKIARGTIEITADLKLVAQGEKVGASEATLLNMLNISPFTYGLGISQVYDQGQTFAPEVLDIKEEQLLSALNSAIKTVTTISLAVNYPTLPSIMHTLVNGYKKVLAVAIETDYSWPEIDELKDRIANPDAYASSAPVGTTSDAKEDAPVEEKKEEEGKSISIPQISEIALTRIRRRRRGRRHGLRSLRLSVVYMTSLAKSSSLPCTQLPCLAKMNDVCVLCEHLL
jgi:large subunit ribosomal protein LP0